MEVHCRPFHKATLYASWLTSTARYPVLLGWLVPLPFSAWVVERLDLNLEIWLILRASSKLFQITAINSWSPQHGATFQSHAGESRIDFILTRLKDADNMAKQVGLTVTAPFLSDSSHHVPADQHFLQIFQTFQISSWCYTAGKADMSSGDDALLWLFISLQV